MFNQVTFMLPIWIKTFRPYIAITGDWVSSGHLIDVYNEFVIQRFALMSRRQTLMMY